MLLLRSIKDTGDYLNLSPFIVDLQDADLGLLRSAGLRSDIYLFRSLQNDQAIYVGANAQQEHDLTKSDQWDELNKEFERMKVEV